MTFVVNMFKSVPSTEICVLLLSKVTNGFKVKFVVNHMTTKCEMTVSLHCNISFQCLFVAVFLNILQFLYCSNVAMMKVMAAVFCLIVAPNCLVNDLTC